MPCFYSASWHALIQDLKLDNQNFQHIWLIKVNNNCKKVTVYETIKRSLLMSGQNCFIYRSVHRVSKSKHLKCDVVPRQSFKYSMISINNNYYSFLHPADSCVFYSEDTPGWKELCTK